MTITAEISMYPLTESYKQPIIEFIKRLRNHPELDIVVSATNTRVVGPFEGVMAAFREETARAFEAGQTVVLVTKFFNADLREDPVDL